MNKSTFIAFILLLIACTSPRQNSEETSASNTAFKIAYNVGYDTEADDYEVFMMDLNGENKENLSNSGGVDWTYYAHKNNLYFISDRDTTHRVYFLYEMTFPERTIRKVSDLRLADSWFSSRKNGKEFIVTPHRTVDSVFYLIDHTGNLLRKIDPGLPYRTDPCFSPDGKQIVFRGAKAKFKKDAGYIDELYIMNDDGSGLKQLTHYPRNDTSAEWYNYKAGPPRWNSVENFITYQSNQQGKSSLYAITPDGNKQWKLTENTRQEGWHDWSSDGKWLAIEMYDADQSQFHIGLMDWKTKDLRILTDTSFTYQQAPVFLAAE